MSAKKQSIIAFTEDGPALRIGGMLLRQLPDGSIWLENKEGEGMQTPAELLGQHLDEFFRQHF